MSRAARAALAIALLALTVACGQDSTHAPVIQVKTVPAQQWAKDVCTAVRPWARNIQTAVSNTQKTLGASTSPQVVKPQLTQLFFGAAKATDTAIAGVDKAGVPDVANGTKIARDFRAALVGARDAFAAAERSVQALETSDKAKFDAAVAKIGTQLRTDYAKAGKNIEKATSEELTTAFQAEPACR